MPRDALLTAGRLQVRFVWLGDRFGHEVSLLTSDGSAPILQSVEGTADDPWPPSPPLQSVHVETRGDAQVALAVGMAGASHWSASVETQPEDRLRFDIACRIRGEPGALGSRYRIMPDVAVEALDSGIWLQSAAGRCVLAGESVVGQAGALEAGGENVAVLAPGDQGSTSVRWCYTIGSGPSGTP